MARIRTRRSWPRVEGVIIRGRAFTQHDLVVIRRLIRRNPSWGRTKLSQHVCAALGWIQPDGRVKERACRVALLRLEELGFVRLPKRLLNRGGRPPCVDAERDLYLRISPVTEMPSTIEMREVTSTRDSRLWNALVAKFHYLGLPTPVGRILRYLMFGDDCILGAISFGECAWRVSARDNLLSRIGVLPPDVRTSVVGNNRFVILPGVKVKNLASRILGGALRRIPGDWAGRFFTRPLFVETFVDPSRFTGACYRAANWLFVGKTKGFSKKGSRHRESSGPKLIFLRGLTKASHRALLDSGRECPADEGPIAA